MENNKLKFTEEELDLIQSVYCPHCHKELDFMSVSYLEGFCIDGCELELLESNGEIASKEELLKQLDEIKAEYDNACTKYRHYLEADMTDEMEELDEYIDMLFTSFMELQIKINNL